MSVLETAILFEEETLLAEKFYTSKTRAMIAEKVRNSLVTAIIGLSEEAFGDSIENFQIGEYIIAMITQFISEPDTEVTHPLRMYCIAEKETNKTKLKEAMTETLFQFVNRFSKFDIFTKNIDVFEEFSDRFEKIFKDLIEKEDNSVEKEFRDAEKERIRQEQLVKSKMNINSFR